MGCVHRIRQLSVSQIPLFITEVSKADARCFDPALLRLITWEGQNEGSVITQVSTVRHVCGRGWQVRRVICFP